MEAFRQASGRGVRVLLETELKENKIKNEEMDRKNQSSRIFRTRRKGRERRRKVIARATATATQERGKENRVHGRFRLPQTK